MSSSIKKEASAVLTFAAEIISEYSFKRDTVAKKLYEEFKLREFWLIEPLYETVTVYTYSKNLQALQSRGSMKEINLLKCIFFLI